jgi:hypothetical protein
VEVPALEPRITASLDFFSCLERFLDEKLSLAEAVLDRAA